jgi:glyoxylase-like metal-dependent hydrolase (beta-lactamase superfamily II)
LVCLNCFLVREDDGLTLVDTIMGPLRQWDLYSCQFVESFAAADSADPCAWRPYRLAGCAVDNLIGVEVAVGRRESRLLTRDFRTEPGEPPDKIRGMLPKVETIPSALLSDGESYGSLMVIATPGHTPGHLSFFDPRSGTLIAGDALTNVGGLRVVSDGPTIFPFASMGTWHKPAALESARKLAALEPKRIVMGHGKPVVENATQLLEEAIRHAE